VPIFLHQKSQSRTVIEEKESKALSYKKAVHKLWVKLTLRYLLGLLHEICETLISHALVVLVVVEKVKESVALSVA